MEHDEHDAANLLGAAAVAVMDGIGRATAAMMGHGGETAAAFVAIGHHPGLSNDELGRVLGLSHPGTVRLVDRLVAAGMVERRPARDRRAVSLHLTEAGVTRRAELLAERKSVLDSILGPLSAEEQAVLGGLLARMLGQLPKDPLHGLSICRLCDERGCVNCPIDKAVGV